MHSQNQIGLHLSISRVLAEVDTTIDPDVLVDALCESALLVDTLWDCCVLPDVDTGITHAISCYFIFKSCRRFVTARICRNDCL